VRVLDIGDKKMGADEADAGSGAEVQNLREGASGLTREAAGLGLAGERMI
jgi:hypothetical protein